MKVTVVLVIAVCCFEAFVGYRIGKLVADRWYAAHLKAPQVTFSGWTVAPGEQYIRCDSIGGMIMEKK